MKEAGSDVHRAINVSLVAFYGDKPLGLRSLIERLHIYLATHQLLQDKFIPYQIEQVHGTIIGCEGLKTQQGIISKWYKERRQETKYIDFDLVNYLRHQVDLPINIRFGGYDRNFNYNFLSRNQHLYNRSFQLQSAVHNTIPVVIGWSWENERVTSAMDNLRRQFQQFNLLHKYHGTPDAVDNDFYLRLGTIKAQLSPAEIDSIAAEIRNLLKTSPISIPVNLNNLAVVKYQDLQLTPATTKVLPVEKITACQLRQLYSD